MSGPLHLKMTYSIDSTYLKQIKHKGEAVHLRRNKFSAVDTLFLQTLYQKWVNLGGTLAGHMDIQSNGGGLKDKEAYWEVTEAIELTKIMYSDLAE